LACLTADESTFPVKRDPDAATICRTMGRSRGCWFC
jgi:hypothetical protein